jgi:hypothetical protein
MKESQLQKKVKKAIQDKYGKNVWYYHPKDRCERGLPDGILSFYGIFVAFELKKDLFKYPLGKLQEYNLKKISETKGFSIQADDVDILIYALDQIKQDYCLTKHNR